MVDLSNLILSYRGFSWIITKLYLILPRSWLKVHISFSKCTEYHFMLASRFNKANLEPCVGSSSPFRAKPHKLSASRLDAWLCALREISFVVAATISSPLKWHQTGGTLFQAYKWPNVQVLHLIHHHSQIADRPKMELMIHNVFLLNVQMGSLINFVKPRRL